MADVKCYRFVSNLWNVEASKILKKSFTLDFGPNFDYKSKDSNETMKVFRYVADMKNNPLSNWRIHIPETKNKLFQDLNWLLSDGNSKIHHVKRLEFCRSVASLDSNPELTHKVLQTLGKHLEELALDYNFNRDIDWVKDYGLPELTQFPKLQVFTLSHDCNERFTGWEHLIKLIKGTKSIRLNCSESTSLSFLDTFYEKQSWKVFSNLNELSLRYTNPDLINILLKLPIRLKKLELNELKDMKNWIFVPLENSFRNMPRIWKVFNLLFRHSQRLVIKLKSLVQSS